MIRTAFTLALALAVVACGEAIGTGSTPDASVVTTTTAATSTSTSSDVISVGDLGVIVPPNDAGEYPPDLIVSCGTGDFPLSALDSIEPLEQADPNGLAEAVAPFLEGGEGQFWPQQGWQILHQTDEEALLVVNAEGALSFMNLTNDGSGWKWAGASGGGSECPLEFLYPESINAVTWRLDPAAPPLTSESTEIAVILNERPCVDGREIGDRLLPPEIVMTGTQVFMAFAAERPPGDAFTCPGNPDTPYVAELPAPLGDRSLMPGVQLGIDLADYVDEA